MDYTQNCKIEQVKESTLVIGIDVGSETHYARAFDWRGRELTKKVFCFSSDIEGFSAFYEWASQISNRTAKTDMMIGCEPTGHYWYTLEAFLSKNGLKLVFVNPASVKRVKELDDNSPKKTDRKDPKVIAKLVIDGRFIEPYVPDGIYSDLREVVSSRDRILKELNCCSNRIQRWLSIYFPEYKKVYKKFDSESGMRVLQEAPLPCDIIALGCEKIVQIWRRYKLRAVGMKRAQTLVEAAHNSVGKHGGNGARIELQMLLEDYRVKNVQLEMVTQSMQSLLMQVPHIEKLLAIKGVGVVTAAGFVAEVGDIGRFDSPKQIQKLAGFEIVENSSGKHNGKKTISKRGRRKLRKILFQVVLPLIRSNKEFRNVYDYYTMRVKNPLKGRQAIIAVACKLIRIFYAMLSKGVDYDPYKLLSDIRRPQDYIAA